MCSTTCSAFVQLINQLLAHSLVLCGGGVIVKCWLCSVSTASLARGLELCAAMHPRAVNELLCSGCIPLTGSSTTASHALCIPPICTLPCKVSGRVGASETLLANIAFVGTTASIHITLEGMESSDGARAMLRLSAEFSVRKSELTPVCCLLREAGRQQGSQPLALTCGLFDIV
jgi:hypothetical protein